MKIKLLFLTLIGAVSIATAQYTVTDISGTELHDGDIREFNVYGYGTEANFEFFVKNDHPSDVIYTRIEFVSAVNATGNLFELCYAEQCYDELSVGQTLPSAPEVYPIGPGEMTGMGNHFLNYDPGNGEDILEYVFAFRQYEADGLTEIGTPLTFTYRYNPTLGVEDMSTVNLSIQSTVVSDQLVLTVNEPVQMIVYDIQGRLVKQMEFENGNHSVNVSDLNTQMY